MTDTGTGHRPPPAIAAMSAELFQRRLSSANPVTRAKAQAEQAARVKAVEPVKLEPVKVQRKRKPQIFRERDITRAIAGHMKAGLAVAGTKIAPDGSIVIITGTPEAVNLAPSDEQTEPANEWDTPL